MVDDKKVGVCDEDSRKRVRKKMANRRGRLLCRGLDSDDWQKDGNN